MFVVVMIGYSNYFLDILITLKLCLDLYFINSKNDACYRQVGLK